MSLDPVDLLPAQVLVVDDEQQIHAALRLRFGFEYHVVYCLSAHDALEKLAARRFDLCIADINMPGLDGFGFIDAARIVDPQLGYVVLSAFDTDANLRRTIPLQVYDFISKPLPEQHEFDARMRAWVDATRKKRREHALACQADTIAGERDSARMERDVELVASESARDCLMQTAGMISTINAHLLQACTIVSSRVKADPSLVPLLRGLEEGRRAAEAIANITESFLGSAYGSRDSSPALINDGIRDAISLATRDPHVQQLKKAVHFLPLDAQLPVRGLSGIAFLLMIFPALAAALSMAPPNSTVRIRGDHYGRLDTILKDRTLRGDLWVNRRNALISHPGWLIVITAATVALTREQIELWLKGEYVPLNAITPRGMVAGVQRCHGLLGFSISPDSDYFRLSLALPA
jgi:CheY-like chemotaxis protein